MVRGALFFFSAAFMVTGVYIFVQPRAFFDMTPGLSMMGGYNVHLVRDVGLAFLACAGAIGWGAWKYNRPVVLAGCAWIALHGIFHAQIWMARSFSLDHIFWFDLFAVIIPAAIVTALAARLQPPAEATA